jgi:hypothetical protein
MKHYFVYLSYCLLCVGSVRAMDESPTTDEISDLIKENDAVLKARFATAGVASEIAEIKVRLGVVERANFQKTKLEVLTKIHQKLNHIGIEQYINPECESFNVRTGKALMDGPTVIEALEWQEKKVNFWFASWFVASDLKGIFTPEKDRLRARFGVYKSEAALVCDDLKKIEQIPVTNVVTDKAILSGFENRVEKLDTEGDTILKEFVTLENNIASGPAARIAQDPWTAVCGVLLASVGVFCVFKG